MKKRNIVKIFSLLTALCMVSGCKVSTIAETTTMTTVTTTAETTMSGEKAKKDLLLAELENGIEMNDKKYSIPFTLEDLGKEYYATGSDTEYDVFYKDEYFAYVTIDEFDDYLKSNVKSISFASNTNFKFGEIYCGNSREKIYEMYGEPDEKIESGIAELYIFDNGIGFCIEYDNDKIADSGITFSN